MDQLKEAKAITEDDILAGEIELSVALRKGGRAAVIVRALPWRAIMRAAAISDPAELNAIILQAAVGPDLGDAFLNSLTPQSLGQILGTANALTNGVDALKKNRESLQQLLAHNQPTPIFSMPNPNSLKPDGQSPNCDASAQPN